MTAVIRFKTALFDVMLEPENPINPIHGSSLLVWLAQRSHGVLEISEPDVEDWGWYSYTDLHGQRYMLGSSASEQEQGAHEWVLQVTKHRSFMEKLLGRNTMSEDDACVAYLVSLLANEPKFSNVSTDPQS